jgi:hypothetical protein
MASVLPFLQTDAGRIRTYSIEIVQGIDDPRQYREGSMP